MNATSRTESLIGTQWRHGAACTSCDTSYERCTAQVLGASRACCRDCGSHDTHDEKRGRLAAAVPPVDLRRAAITVLNATDASTPEDLMPFHYTTGITLLWEALTGLEGTAALALARRLASSPAPVLAYVPPL